jgi:hypothetical protein
MDFRQVYEQQNSLYDQGTGSNATIIARVANNLLGPDQSSPSTHFLNQIEYDGHAKVPYIADRIWDEMVSSSSDGSHNDEFFPKGLQLNGGVYTSEFVDSPKVGAVEPTMDSGYIMGIGKDGKASREHQRGIMDFCGIYERSSKTGVSICHIPVLKDVF